MNSHSDVAGFGGESANWKPSCSMRTLRIRAAMLRATREFFASRGYLEVETPCLSSEIVIDAWLEPMMVRQNNSTMYLQTSPEAFMKRLLAAGSGSIYQIAHVFRAGETGRRHNPEFTMIEWYGVGSDWEQQMDLTESLVRFCMDAARRETADEAALRGDNLQAIPEWDARPFRRTTYQEAFRRSFQLDVYAADEEELRDVCAKRQIPLPEPTSELLRDDLLNAMLAFAVEPNLGGLGVDGLSAPEYLCDYPPTQAALAVISETSPRVARRFELYINGLELCNGYHELTDAVELRRREEKQNQVRSESCVARLPGAGRLAAAMDAGLPECSGVALGFDRLVMIATGAESVSEVLSFAADRA